MGRVQLTEPYTSKPISFKTEEVIIFALRVSDITFQIHNIIMIIAHRTGDSVIIYFII